jgi:hypothetical protein
VPLSRNLGTLTSWNPLGHSRPVTGLTVSCTMGTGSFPGVKCGWGLLLTTHPLLMPRSRKVELYLYSPLRPSRPVTGELYLLYKHNFISTVFKIFLPIFDVFLYNVHTITWQDIANPTIFTDLYKILYCITSVRHTVSHIPSKFYTDQYRNLMFVKWRPDGLYTVV